MLSRDELQARLDEAENAIRDGQVGSSPREFLDALWAEVEGQAPVDMRNEVYERLLDFGSLLGIRHTTVAQERLSGPRWDMFVAALEELPDAT